MTIRREVALLVGVAVLLAGFAVFTLSLSGCVPRIQRACTGNRCYIVASASQVDRQFAKLKPQKWDSGETTDNGSRARCFTKLSADRRYIIWITRGEESCVVHEECHITQFEDDGYRFFAANHKKCHGFGLSK